MREGSTSRRLETSLLISLFISFLIFSLSFSSFSFSNFLALDLSTVVAKSSRALSSAVGSAELTEELKEAELRLDGSDRYDRRLGRWEFKAIEAC